jgi:hypothetical protein
VFVGVFVCVCVYVWVCLYVYNIFIYICIYLYIYIHVLSLSHLIQASMPVARSTTRSASCDERKKEENTCININVCVCG